MINKFKIIYTLTDEAPALATYSLLPIIHKFTKSIGIFIETRDISLASRIIANFPEYLNSTQRLSDHLIELSQLVVKMEANIIKLPNISASLPQIQAAVIELQNQGYALPNYIDDPKTKEEEEINFRYEKIKGSAVNPVLRAGNSDRRILPSVKNYARKHPHFMGKWNASSRSHVAHMLHDDFYGSEKSILIQQHGNISINFISSCGDQEPLKIHTVQPIDIIDAAVMSKHAFSNFITQQIQDAKQKKILLSLHLKASMMKISDSIMFGVVVSEFYKEVFDQYREELQIIGFNPNNGISDLYFKISKLPIIKQTEIIKAIKSLYAERPQIAMVNLEQEITNLHVPNGMIIDASMPAMIRNAGKMCGSDGKFHDTKAIIPDRSYAGVYQTVIQDCKQHGAFDPTTMGSMHNIGLMAEQAEEYGSHDKTFQISTNGTVHIIDDTGKLLLEHPVDVGDIWRMTHTKSEPIYNWVKLAIDRTRESGIPAVFWLDQSRAHDRLVTKQVRNCLKNYDTNGLDIRIMSPVDATLFSIERIRKGKDIISVTGNVLRDYLTDLFPIIELGSSSKMLSIVPLMAGGTLFETGAGGTAPNHVQQFIKENHLRWDSLGEFIALFASLERIGTFYDNRKTKILANMLDNAINKLLSANKFPSGKVGELDTRGSHFYLALFWAQALAEQNEDFSLKHHFTTFSHQLTNNEENIISDINLGQGKNVDIGGYYHPHSKLVKKIMCPSVRFSNILQLI
ncbi:NADP-dependent isocitrate dehydrogenase [Candidatus Curculioniphilus buchneri]|uniref:NADP-dependent isocitrate dehydrogenase n=1 Tax=Candidatus Curculioniphilus buchneri TaxID=690594 RepID=UPI00376F1F9F